MSQEFEPDDIDAMLRRSLRARPEANPSFDLAARAIAIASPATRTLRELARVHRWNQILTSAAAVLIVGISLWIIHGHLAAGGFQGWSDTSTDTTTVSTVSTDTSSSTMQWMFIGAAMAVGAVVVIVAQRSLSAADEWTVAWAAPLR